MAPPFLLFTFLLFSFFSKTSGQNSESSYRLPGDVKPNHYDITLNPSLNTSSFFGSVNIEISILNSTNSITVHSAELNIYNVSVFTCDNFTIFLVVNITVDDVRNFLVIQTDEYLLVNTSVCIFIEYEGILRNETFGFFRSSYIDQEGSLRWLAATRFLPAFARYAFPCFDEPAFKAEFTIRVLQTPGYLSISNTPQEGNTTRDGQVYDTFQRSPRISTYLVAIIITSNHTYISETIQSVFARSELINDGRANFALEMAHTLLNTLEEVVGMEYTSHNTKLDNVALPHINAVYENWGLITYGERNLLYKDNVTTSFEHQEIVENIARKYSHNWFGNLVTPSWWSYLWISEGISTYLGQYATNYAQPSWEILDVLAFESWENVAESDSLESTRPLTYDVETPQEILDKFNTITSDKGAIVMRQLEGILGSGLFRTGINNFLVNRQMDVGSEEDLWRAFQGAIDDSEASGPTLPHPLQEIMRTWTQQSGFPLLTVDILPNTGGMNITQERFLFYNISHDIDQLWYLPITFSTENNLNFSDVSLTHWLVEESQYFPSIEVPTNSWIIINNKLSGLYRVNYCTRNWNMLSNYLNNEDFEQIHPVNRAQIIDDSLNLARVGRLDYHIVLELINYVRRELEYLPVHSFIKNIRFVDRLFRTSIRYADLTNFVMGLLEPTYLNLTVNEQLTDQHLDKLKRQKVLSFLCDIGHEGCLQEMNTMLKSRNYIPPDLQSVAYCGGLRSGGEEDWDNLYTLYQSSDTEQPQKERILQSLGCILNATLLGRLVSMSLTLNSEEWRVDSVDEQFIVLVSLFSNTNLGLTLTLSHLFSGFQNLVDRFSNSQINFILEEFSSRLVIVTQQNLFRQMLQFLPNSIQVQFNASITRAYLNMDENNNWTNENQVHINEWLELRSTTLPPTESTPITNLPENTRQTDTTRQPETTRHPATTRQPETTIQPGTTEKIPEDDDIGRNFWHQNYIYIVAVLVVLCLITISAVIYASKRKGNSSNMYKVATN